MELSKTLLRSVVGKTPENTVNTASGLLSGRTNTNKTGFVRAAVGYGKAQHQQKTASLASASALSLLDPVGVYSADLKTYDNMPAILNLCLQSITSYVLRSIPFLADSTSRDVIKVLTQIHPSKITMENARRDHPGINPAEYKFGLPTTEARKSKNFQRRGVITGTASGLRDANDYAVGKSFTIDLPMEGMKKPFQIAMEIVVTARYTPVETIIEIARGGAPENHWMERWIKFRAGSTTLGDIATQGDRVQSNIKARHEDKSGVMDEIRRRKNNATIATTFDGKVRYGIGSSFVVITLSDAEELQKKLRFEFSDYRQRQDIMAAFSALIFIIVDKEDDFVIIYYRDIRLPSEVTIKQITKLFRDKTDSAAIMMESLRQLSSNKAPVL